MQQETAQELIDWQRQDSLSVFVSGIPPAECYFIVPETNETSIGDRHAMSVGSEVAQHLGGSTEWRFAVHHPAQREQLTDETLKQPRLRPAPQHAMKPYLS